MTLSITQHRNAVTHTGCSLRTATSVWFWVPERLLLWKVCSENKSAYIDFCILSGSGQQVHFWILPCCKYTDMQRPVFMVCHCERSHRDSKITAVCWPKPLTNLSLRFTILARPLTSDATAFPKGGLSLPSLPTPVPPHYNSHSPPWEDTDLDFIHAKRQLYPFLVHKT